MSDLVVVDRLVKRYGPRVAVRGVSFAIEEGEVIGLLGPNGSGKSTILRVLAGYLPPSSGNVRIDGIDVAADSLAARARVGYVPEDAPLYDGMRVGEFLHFMAAIKGVVRRAVHGAVASAAEQLELGLVLGMPIGKLSRGYRQRVAIAQALLNDPPLLILDEPTNALDAYQVIAVRALVRSLAGRRTVLVASHVLTEIERVASRIIILVDGRLLTTDAMREASGAPSFRLRIAGPGATVLAALRAIPGVIDAVPADTAKSYLVKAGPSQLAAADLARAIVGQGFALSGLTEAKPDLEHVFLDLTRQVSTMPANVA
ncbi:MAG: ABC transporter ATP-binding protein [Alphaproteobacteria bacterium]|nr:ABC transporter ATP-binding protein [Alphaproteobacteria bacterium]